MHMRGQSLDISLVHYLRALRYHTHYTVWYHRASYDIAHIILFDILEPCDIAHIILFDILEPCDIAHIILCDILGPFDIRPLFCKQLWEKYLKFDFCVTNIRCKTTCMVKYPKKPTNITLIASTNTFPSFSQKCLLRTITKWVPLWKWRRWRRGQFFPPPFSPPFFLIKKNFK